MLPILLLVLSGYIFSKGFFSLQSIIVLIVSYIFLFIAILKPKLIHSVNALKPSHMLFILTILSATLYGGLYQKSHILILLSFLLLGISVIFSFLLLEVVNLSSLKKIYISMFLIAILLRLFMIWSSPQPIIDIFIYLKYGALYFLSGVNPYTLVYSPLYQGLPFDYYAYPAGTLLSTLPFVWLFKDPRYTFVFAEILTSLICLRINSSKIDKYIYSLILLFNPISLFMIEQSYMEPLAVLLLTVSLWLFLKNKLVSSFAALGFAISTKQYLVFLIPLFFKLLKKGSLVFRLLLTLITIVVIALLNLPFFLWNQSEFLRDVVYLQFTYPPRYEGLSIFSLFHIFGINYIPILSAVAILSTFIFVYVQRKITISRFLYLSSFLFFSFFIFNKWAFINYYYLVSQLLTIGIIFEMNEITPSKLARRTKKDTQLK